MKKGIFPFDVGRWRADGSLSRCMPNTRGVWLEALFVMWDAKHASLEGTPEQLAALCRCTVNQFMSAVVELDKHAAADIKRDTRNGHVTLTCRFLARKFKTLTQTRLRVQRHRNPPPPPGDVTPPGKQQTGTESGSASGSGSVSQSATPLPPSVPSVPLVALPAYAVAKARIDEVYGPGRRWTNYEESMLCEIARTGQAETELDLILRFRNTMPPQDRARFFPQSVSRLLSNWSEILDRARVSAPPGPRPPKVDKLKNELDKL